MGVVVLQNGLPAAVALGKQALGGGIAHHIAGGQAQHPAEHHRRRRKLRAAARMALVQKIQHRVGPVGWLGRVTGVGTVLVQVAAHKGSYRVGVTGQLVFFFRCIAKFLQCAVVCAVWRRQVAALGVGRGGAFQPVQHTGIRVGTGGQQRFCLPAREVVERVVLRGLACCRAVAIQAVVVVKIGVVGCKSVGIAGVQPLHGHLLRCGTIVSGPQKRQVRDCQTAVTVGFPAGGGIVELLGVRRLPAMPIVFRADKPAQVDRLRRLLVGRDE